MYKIDVLDIIKDHVKTLNAGDWYFILLPLVFASTALYWNCYLDKDMVSILNTGFSIFLGLFFNVVVLLFDMVKKTIKEVKDIEIELLKNTSNTEGGEKVVIIDKVKMKLLRQTLVNICFLILLSIIGILFGYLALFSNKWVVLVSNFFVYGITSLFFLTVLMVLRRIYTLFINEFDTLSK